MHAHRPKVLAGLRLAPRVAARVRVHVDDGVLPRSGAQLGDLGQVAVHPCDVIAHRAASVESALVVCPATVGREDERRTLAGDGFTGERALGRGVAKVSERGLDPVEARLTHGSGRT